MVSCDMLHSQELENEKENCVAKLENEFFLQNSKTIWVYWLEQQPMCEIWRKSVWLQYFQK